MNVFVDISAPPLPGTVWNYYDGSNAAPPSGFNKLTYSNAYKTVTLNSINTDVNTRGSTPKHAGKAYFEVLVNNVGATTGKLLLGLKEHGMGSHADLWSSQLDAIVWSSDGSVWTNGNGTLAGTIATYTTGDVLGFAYEPGVGVAFFKNNVSQGSFAKVFEAAIPQCAIASHGSGFPSATLRCSSASQAFSPPTGYAAWDTPVFPLDGYETGIWFAGGVRKLFSAYNGKCMRVYRAHDAAETDIGFTAEGSVDWVAISEFSHGVYPQSGQTGVKRLYDQSGNGNHHDYVTQTGWNGLYYSPQPTAGNSPRFRMWFNGETSFSGINASGLQSINNGGTGTAKTFFTRSTFRNTYSSQTMVEYGASNNINGTNNHALRVSDEGGTTARLQAGGGTNNSSVKTHSRTNIKTFGAVFLKGQSPGYNGLKLYGDGSLLAATSNSDTGSSMSPDNFAAEKWTIGRNHNQWYPAGLNAYYFAIYEADKSADAAAITLALR